MRDPAPITVELARDAIAGFSPSNGSAALVADLNSTWGYIENALTGLSHRGETDSPLVRDLIAAQEKIQSIKKQMPPNE